MTDILDRRTRSGRPADAKASRSKVSRSKEPRGKRTPPAKGKPTKRSRAPRPYPPRSSSERRALATHGLTRALGSAGIGIVLVEALVLTFWASDAHSAAPTGQALRIGLSGWLLAQRAGLAVGRGTVALPPLGLTLMLGTVLAQGGAAVARDRAVREWREVIGIVAAISTPYAVVAGAVASVAAQPVARPAAGQAVIGALVVAAIASTIGVLRVADRRLLLRGLRPDTRATLAAGVVAGGVLLTGGALLAAASLAFHGGSAQDLSRALADGVVGTIGLLLLQLAFLPNAAVWGAAYLTGPGFAVGIGTNVSPIAVHLAGVPALPLLAALPSSGLPMHLRLGVFAIPVLAGLAAGAVVVRRVGDASLGRVCWLGFCSGPVAGLGLAVAAALAGGPSGPGRMATVGPSWWKVGLAVAEEVGFTGALAAAAAHWWVGRRN